MFLLFSSSLIILYTPALSSIVDTNWSSEAIFSDCYMYYYTHLKTLTLASSIVIIIKVENKSTLWSFMSLKLINDESES